MGLNKNCLANDITCLIYQGPHAERRHDFLFLLLGLLRGLISLEVYNKKKIVDLIPLLYIVANREGNSLFGIAFVTVFCQILKFFLFFLLKLSAVYTFWIVLMC
jgi:predicted neutral ceramidase superfamily lipid hydrolase